MINLYIENLFPSYRDVDPGLLSDSGVCSVPDSVFWSDSGFCLVFRQDSDQDFCSDFRQDSDPGFCSVFRQDSNPGFCSVIRYNSNPIILMGSGSGCIGRTGFLLEGRLRFRGLFWGSVPDLIFSRVGSGPYQSEAGSATLVSYILYRQPFVLRPYLASIRCREMGVIHQLSIEEMD